MKNNQDPNYKNDMSFSDMSDAPINTGSNQEDYNNPRNWGGESDEEHDEDNDESFWEGYGEGIE